MIKPLPHKNEIGRLEELESFDILDTLTEEDYDNLTSLAAEICGTKISLVSLIDEKRQWFKSSHGIEATETLRDYAFCAHALHEEEVFIVEDSRKDERFIDNPLVVGSPNVIFYAGVPLISDNNFPLGTLCVIDDHPKRMTDKQIRSLKGLGKQVMNLLNLRKKTAKLEQSLHKITAINKELEQFTYLASHDLKESLRTISSFIDLSKGESRTYRSDKMSLYLNFIGEANTRMITLVNDLLDFYSIGDKPIIGWVDCAVIIQNVMDDLETLISKSNTTIIVGKLPMIKGFNTEIRLLFQNLISNAIKFHRLEVNPIIKIDCIEQKNQWLFSVKDNGIGIEANQMGKIFLVFQRLHDRDDYEGTGIGLAHCKKIIDLHEGDIWGESIVNEGSVFHFTIPKRINIYD